jgi:hypothetical protein
MLIATIHTNMKSFLLLFVLLLATLSLTFGDVRHDVDHAAATTYATTTTTNDSSLTSRRRTIGLRKTAQRGSSVRQLKSSKGSSFGSSFQFSVQKPKKAAPVQVAKTTVAPVQVVETTVAPVIGVVAAETAATKSDKKSSKDKNKKGDKSGKKSKNSKSSSSLGTATVENILVAAPDSESTQDVEAALGAEALNAITSRRRNLESVQSADGVTVTTDCVKQTTCDLIFESPDTAPAPDFVTCYVCVITINTEAGSGIDAAAEADIIAGLIEDGSFTEGLNIIVVFVGAPDFTYVPTSVPTAAPIATPTATPTASPTASPTSSPTTNPSATPTGSATINPTPGPTDAGSQTGSGSSSGSASGSGSGSGSSSPSSS